MRAMSHPSGSQNAPYVTHGGLKMTPWSAKGVPKGHFGHPRGAQREVQERVPKRDPKTGASGKFDFRTFGLSGAILGGIWGPAGSRGEPTIHRGAPEQAK